MKKKKRTGYKAEKEKDANFETEDELEFEKDEESHSSWQSKRKRSEAERNNQKKTFVSVSGFLLVCLLLLFVVGSSFQILDHFKLFSGLRPNSDCGGYTIRASVRIVVHFALFLLFCLLLRMQNDLERNLSGSAAGPEGASTNLQANFSSRSIFKLQFALDEIQVHNCFSLS